MSRGDRQVAPNSSSRYLSCNSLAAAFIFILGLIIQLVYLLEVRSCPLLTYPILDMLWHREWALKILSGAWLGEDVFFRAPLYPYFLSAVMWVAGEGYFWPRVLQALVGSLTPMLVFLLALRLESQDEHDSQNNRRGLPGWPFAAGVATAFYPLIIFFNTEFLIPVLAIPLDVALVLSLLRLKGAEPGIKWALPGILLGLSAIARPTILAFSAGILAWLFLSRPEKPIAPCLKRALIIFAVTIVIIAPVTIRNYMVGEDFVLISSQGGVNFWIGNNPNADGKTAVSPGIFVDYGPYRDSVWVTSELEAERALERELKPSEVSRYWLKRALEFILTEPDKSLPLFLKKIYFLVNGSEIPSNQSIYYYRQESWLMRALLWPGPIKLPFGLLLPVAAAGMFMLLNRWRDFMLLYLFIIIYGSVVVAFFVNARFRIPLAPFLIISAVCGIRQWLKDFRQEHRSKALAGLLIFLALFVVSNTGFFDVEADDLSGSYRTMGYHYYERQEYEEAEELFNKAYQMNPDNADNNNAIANIYFLDKDYEKALEYYRQAAFLEPQHPEIYFNLAITYEAMGKLKDAERNYIRALRLAPEYQRARDRLQSLMLRQGKIKHPPGTRP